MKKQVKELLDRLGVMKSRRQPHEHAWQDISNYMMPFRGDVTTKTSPGRTRTKPVFDSTAMIAADQLVNFMKGALLPPSEDWLRLSPPFDYGTDDEIRKGLDVTAQRVLHALAESNFYQEATTALRDLILIGNSALMIEEEVMRPRGGSDFGGLMFETIPMSRCWWSQGKGGRCIMFVREHELPAIDAARFFKNPGSEALRHLEQDKPMELATYYQFVYENEDAISGGVKSKQNKPYVSTWITEANGGEVVRESGFDFAPYTVARMSRVDGEEYGRGRGHIARADARGISELRRQVLLAASKDLNPPLMVEDDTMVDMDIAAGGIVVTRPPIKMEPNYLRSGTDYAAADKIARDDRDQIRQAFLSDVLSEPETQPRSAEESRQRQSRSLQRLAAVADIINGEFLGPAIECVVGIMARADALPEAAAIAEKLGGGVSATVKFVSPFFSAQKSQSLFRVQGFLERRLALLQATQDPAYIEDIDPDKLRQFDVKVSDVPIEIFRTEEEIKEMREARAEKAAQQRMIEEQSAMEQQQGGLPQQQQPPPPEGAAALPPEMMEGVS